MRGSLENRGWRILQVFFSAVLLTAVALLIYDVGLYASARALTRSAKEIHSAADARQQLARWRHRPLVRVSEEPITAGGDWSYDVALVNTFLYKIRLVQPAVAHMTVTMNGDELQMVRLMMACDRERSTRFLVELHEWFVVPSWGERMWVHGRRPWGAVFEIPATTPEVERQKLFAFNVDFFVKPAGCKSTDVILPGAWQLAR